MSAEQRDFDREPAVGFTGVRDTTAAEVTQAVRDDKLRRLTIFLMTGLKGCGG